MINKNDLRYVKTEDIIKNAFSECVSQIGFEKTTISEICKKGRISRNTFYFHYLDKYDLLKHLYVNLESKLNNSLEEHTLTELKHYSFRDSIEWTYCEIAKNKDDISLLIKCSRAQMRELLKNTFIDIPLQRLVDNYDRTPKNLKLQLIKNYIADAMIGYIETWLDHYEEISLDEIIDLMEKLCTIPVQIHFDMLGI